jgi:hypothetical protein
MVIFGMGTGFRAGRIHCRLFGKRKFRKIEREIAGVMRGCGEWDGASCASGNIKSNTISISAPKEFSMRNEERF